MKNYFLLYIVGISLTTPFNLALGKEMVATKPIANKISQPRDTIHISLNGVDSATAVKMICMYQDNKKNDVGPIQNSIWFDGVTLKRIYNVLDSERMAERPIRKDSIGYTDGFRIYFACDTNYTSGHMKTSIIIVSTKIKGRDSTVPSGHIHQDYFDHNKNFELFSATPLSAINGLVKRRQWINTRGENLYNLYPKAKGDDTTCTDPHYTGRGKARLMVNQFGKDSLKRKDVMVTNSEWLDFDLLKAFVFDTHQHDGMRIYFARHIAMYKNKQDTDKYKDAFILMATYHVPFLFWSYHNDYFDCKTTTGYFNQLKLKWEHKIGPKIADSSGDGGDDNGEICPTHCPGTTP